MRISVPFLAVVASLSLPMTGPSFAQTNPEPAPAPSASVQGPAPEAAPPRSTPEVGSGMSHPTPMMNHKKAAPVEWMNPPKEWGGGFRGEPDGGFIALVAVASPFITLVAIFAIVLHFRHRRRVVLHETLRAMIEKGLPIPPELLSGGGDGNWSVQPRSAHRDLRGGLVLVGLGAALFFLAGKWGVIPLVIGLALLFVWGFERWEQTRRATTP